MLRTAPPHGSAWIWVLLRRSCVPLVYSVEHFPYTVRCRWHIDVAQFNTTVESVDDSVDDRRRRASESRMREIRTSGSMRRRRPHPHP